MNARWARALAPVLALAFLAGCAGVDARTVVADTHEVFDALVASAAETDAAVLRTLQTAEPSTQPCSRPEGSEQLVLTATGVLSVGADPAEVDTLRDSLADTLDPDIWRPLADGDAPAQSGWISPEGVIVTLAVDGPAVVIAAFAPCLAG